MQVRNRFIVIIAILAATLTLSAAWPTAACVKDSAAPQFTLKAIPISAVHHSWQAPRIRNSDGSSSNWSGYASYVNAQSSNKGKHFQSTPTFIDVVGSWIVPAVISSTSAYTYSSSWVGIDGYTDSTVEQIGTEQDWSNGTPEYYAWFEMYPKGAYEIVGFPVNPGDIISAEVEYTSNGAFKLSITNETENANFSITQRCKSAQRLSAEWIEEAPWWQGVLPLADFGTADFSGCYATTNDGHTGSIDDQAWNFDRITMETSDVS